MKHAQKDTLSRAVMKLLCKFLGVVLVILLAFSYGFHALTEQIHFADPADLTPAGLLSAFSQNASDFFSSQGASPGIGGSRSGIVSILLIGQDRREGEDHARSDSMILCTFHKQSQKITLTSFLRDLYVPIPGFGSNRINAAYSFGGMSLLKKTLEQNFNVHIDGCVEVDFSQFSGIIDVLGGVDITLRQDEARVINQETGSSLTEGPQRLTGMQALTYSRIRSLDLDGDFSRTDRQRKVLTALVDSVRTATFPELLSTTSQLMPMITTDMSRAQILMCAMEILPSLSGTKIATQRIPSDGGYADRFIDGMAVLEADMDAARKLLKQTLVP